MPCFNGITLGGLYFLVASGFTLIFGLMRNVNLAHGSLYLFGGYIGYAVSTCDRLLAAQLHRRLHRGRRWSACCCSSWCSAAWRAQDLRQTMVTIGLSIVFADLMLWVCGGDFYQIADPELADRPDRSCRSSPRSNPPARRSICNIRWCGW